METALLYPQDCLAPTWSHSKRSFAPDADDLRARSPPVLDAGGKAPSAARRSPVKAGGPTILGRKTSAPGLLPLPGNVSPLARFSGSGSGSAVESRTSSSSFNQHSWPYSQKRPRLPVSDQLNECRDTVLNHLLRSPGYCPIRSVAPRVLPPSASKEVRSDSLVSSPHVTDCRLNYDNAVSDWRSIAKDSLPYQLSRSASTFAPSGAKSIPAMQMQPMKRDQEAPLRWNGANSYPIFSTLSESVPESAGRGESSPLGDSELAVDRKMCIPMFNLATTQYGRGEADHYFTLPRGSELHLVPQGQRSVKSSELGIHLRSGTVDPLSLSSSGVKRTPNTCVSTDSSQPRCDSSRIVTGDENLRSPSDKDTGISVEFVKTSQRVYNRSSSDLSHWKSEARDGDDGFDTIYDLNKWMAAAKEPWAGPSFSNSPHPSSLPVPKFASRLTRTCSSLETRHESFACQISLSQLAADTTYATKQLRRILQLDRPCAAA